MRMLRRLAMSGLPAVSLHQCESILDALPPPVVQNNPKINITNLITEEKGKTFDDFDDSCSTELNVDIYRPLLPRPSSA